MPQIELGPNDYRKQVKGRWHLPNEPKLARNMMVVAVGILVFVFVQRDQLTSGTLFGLAAMVGACAGGLFALWLRD